MFIMYRVEASFGRSGSGIYWPPQLNSGSLLKCFSHIRSFSFKVVAFKSYIISEDGVSFLLSKSPDSLSPCSVRISEALTMI